MQSLTPSTIPATAQGFFYTSTRIEINLRKKSNDNSQRGKKRVSNFEVDCQVRLAPSYSHGSVYVSTLCDFTRRWGRRVVASNSDVVTLSVVTAVITLVEDCRSRIIGEVLTQQGSGRGMPGEKKQSRMMILPLFGHEQSGNDDDDLPSY